jgi:hypothetical protein
MAFAIFYEPVDTSQIAGSIQAATLPTALKNTARKYWNNGLKDWATAPYGDSPYDPPNPNTLCRTIVIDGPGCTLAEFRQVLLDIAAFLGTESAQYLIALSQDMGGVSGAVEPWPIP